MRGIGFGAPIFRFLVDNASHIPTQSVLTNAAKIECTATLALLVGLSVKRAHPHEACVVALGFRVSQ